MAQTIIRKPHQFGPGSVAQLRRACIFLAGEFLKQPQPSPCNLIKPGLLLQVDAILLGGKKRLAGLIREAGHLVATLRHGAGSQRHGHEQDSDTQSASTFRS
ncbi:hypothetical protein ACETIH_03275 [Microvirga arabica]|uniref:Uncharacterized protein n=1 Tax=Microvirga arabica TaxID=1128671 RepID=A0ABV6Y3B3_9HYPH